MVEHVTDNDGVGSSILPTPTKIIKKYMRFFSGLIGVIAGFLLVRYSIAITDMFGRVQWAEDHLRGGLAGTYSLYRILGVVFIILSLLYMFGAVGFILSPLGSVFGGLKQ